LESFRQIAPSSSWACDEAATRPGDDFNERADWVADILGPHGWRVHHESNGTLYVTRPRKSMRDGHSATIGHSNALDLSGAPIPLNLSLK
jgi:hypothetical protein